MSRFDTEDPASTEQALYEVGVERERQFAKWGPQHHPDGSGACWPFLMTGLSYGTLADTARIVCDDNAEHGEGTWADILLEELFEALAEEDTVKLRKELVQVAAVAAAWVEDIDSRG